MSVRATLEQKLTAALAPSRLEVIDDSASHAGHAGAHVEGESHFKVEVVAESFEGLNRVARQRLVYAALAEELAGRVHALEVSARTPGEDKTS